MLVVILYVYIYLLGWTSEMLPQSINMIPPSASHQPHYLDIYHRLRP